TTSTPGNLRDELKRSLRRSEIRQRQPRINRNHADQSHIRKIMSLRQHLRTDKRIDATRAEIHQRLLKHFSSRRGVAIDPRDTQGREQQLEHLLELLRAFADVVNVFLSARRANARHGFAMIAVVTDDHALAAMVSERDVAVRTLNGLAARATKYKTRVPAAVQQDDRLLTTLTRLADRFEQLVGKHARLSMPDKYVAHVDDLCLGHRARADAFRQSHEVILAFARVVKRFERRRC